MSFIKKLFGQKEIVVPINKAWRKGMWVIHDSRPAIIFVLGAISEIHYVDAKTGTTVGSAQVSVDSLRQAHYDEIPEVRRGISRERAKELGYGT